MDIFFWAKKENTDVTFTFNDPVVPESKDLYYGKLLDLINDLHKELKRIKDAHKDQIQDQTDLGNKSSVFLAETTDDLDHIREDVRRYLDQQKVNVLPAYEYTREPESYKNLLNEDLEKCNIFIQLLGSSPGKKPPEFSNGYLHFQYEFAKEANKKIYQWRDPQLEIAKVEDDKLRNLLQKETVHAVRIQEFKNLVKKQIQFEPPDPDPVRYNALVFVDRDESDKHVANQVFKVLDKYGVDYVWPVDDGTPAEIRTDFEKHLKDCTVAVIVYGKTDVTWVRSQLLYFRKTLIKRKHPLEAILVYKGPPEKKKPINLKIHGMKEFDCRKEFNEDELIAFEKNLIAFIAKSSDRAIEEKL